MTIQEKEFIAQDTHIDIIPRIALQKLSLLGGEFGPFRPPFKSTVPLWIALELHHRRLCTILPPFWFTSEYLQEILKFEKTHDTFSNLPYEYVEVSTILLRELAGGESVQRDELELVRSLLCEIRGEREKKLRIGIKSLNPHLIQIDNVASVEIEQIKQVFMRGMELERELESQ